MAKVTNIPESDHVLRWAQPKKHLLRDHDGKVIGCDHALFKLRDDNKFIAKYGKPEKNLSVNYVEHFEGQPSDQLKSAVNDYCNGCGASQTTLKKSYFSKLNVGELKSQCSAQDTKIRVIHDATKNSKIKSHGSINQMPQDNTLLFDDLCKLAFKNLHEAKPYLQQSH